MTWIWPIAVVLLVQAQVGCTVSSLRGQHAAASTTQAARDIRRDVAAVALAPDAVLAATDSPVFTAPDRRALRLSDLAFLRIGGSPELFERSGRADFDPGGSLSEADALIVLLARNEQLRGGWRIRQSARHGYSQALHLRRLLDELDGFSRRPDEVRPTQQLPSDESLQGRVVAADVAVAEVQFEQTALDLVARFTRAWYEASYQKRAVGILAESVSLAKRLVRVAETQLAGSRATTTDVLMAKMRLDDLRQRRRSANERRAAALRSLAALLDLVEAPRLGASLPNLALPKLEHARRQALAKGPEVRLARARLDRGQAMLELAERRILPELSFELSERRGQPGRDRFRASYAAGAPYLEELRDRVAAAGRMLAQARTLAPAGAERAHARLSDALRRSRLFKRSQIPRSKRALEAIEAEYRVGRRSFLELDDAQRLWLDTRLGYHLAVRDARIGAAELARVIGGPPTTTDTSTSTRKRRKK